MVRALALGAEVWPLAWYVDGVPFQRRDGLPAFLRIQPRHVGAALGGRGPEERNVHLRLLVVVRSPIFALNAALLHAPA